MVIFRTLTFFLILLSSLNCVEITSTPSKGSWDDYYQNTLNETKPYKTLLLAQEYFKLEQKVGLAVDLGTGTGRDALFLLNHDWKVLAIDAEPLAIEILLNRVPAEKSDNLQVAITAFSNMLLPQQVDLINASFSLPFCKPEEFAKCWEQISDHLVIGGRFAGHFFGDKDDWSQNTAMSFHTQEEMLQLFSENFSIEYLQIEEGLFPTAAGSMKHWHIFHIVAKKIK